MYLNTTLSFDFGTKVNLLVLSCIFADRLLVKFHVLIDVCIGFTQPF